MPSVRGEPLVVGEEPVEVDAFDGAVHQVGAHVQDGEEVEEFVVEPGEQGAAEGAGGDGVDARGEPGRAEHGLRAVGVTGGQAAAELFHQDGRGVPDPDVADGGLQVAGVVGEEGPELPHPVAQAQSVDPLQGEAVGGGYAHGPQFDERAAGGEAVGADPASGAQPGFEHLHAVAEAFELVRGGESGDAGSEHGDPLGAAGGRIGRGGRNGGVAARGRRACPAHRAP
jgi:hypothetical protein